MVDNKSDVNFSAKLIPVKLIIVKAKSKMISVIPSSCYIRWEQYLQKQIADSFEFW